MEQNMIINEASLGWIGCIVVVMAFLFLKEAFNKKKDDKTDQS